MFHNLYNYLYRAFCYTIWNLLRFYKQDDFCFLVHSTIILLMFYFTITIKHSGLSYILEKQSKPLKKTLILASFLILILILINHSRAHRDTYHFDKAFHAFVLLPQSPFSHRVQWHVY